MARTKELPDEPESGVKAEKPKHVPCLKEMLETPKKKNKSSSSKPKKKKTVMKRAKGKLTDDKKKSTKKARKKTKKLDEMKKMACDICTKERRAIDMVFSERMGIKEVMCKTCFAGSSSS